MKLIEILEKRSENTIVDVIDIDTNTNVPIRDLYKLGCLDVVRLYALDKDALAVYVNVENHIDLFTAEERIIVETWERKFSESATWFYNYDFNVWSIEYDNDSRHRINFKNRSYMVNRMRGDLWVKEVDEPFTECFYTGGGIWCTIYQCSGKDSDIYYSFDNIDSTDSMGKFSHSGDYANGFDDEYGFYCMTDALSLDTMTEEEKIIFYKMKLEEAETLKKYDA